MRASDSTFVGTTLAVMCFVMAGPACAFEPVQSEATASPEVPNVAFPVFVDDEWLPQLQAAWETFEEAPQEPPEGKPVASTPDQEEQPASDVSMMAARAAMERAAKSSRSAAVVRRRAEELSRRFGADETPGVVAVTASVDSDPPGEQRQQRKEVIVRSLEQSAGESPALAKRVEAETSSPSEPISTARAESPDMGRKLRLAAPLPVVPPVPVRRTAPPAYDPPPKRHSKKAVPRTRTTYASRTMRRRTRSADEVDENGNSFANFLPTQLRAFGWNTQPE